MAEQEHGISLQNREKGTVTGVKDVISFDEKEILLKTAAGTMTIRGSNLTLTRLDLEKGESDVQGKVDSIVYSRERPKAGKQVKAAVRRWW